MLQQEAEDILTPEGVMEAWLLQAQDVPKMDFFGSGQPYAKYVLATKLAYLLTLAGSHACSHVGSHACSHAVSHVGAHIYVFMHMCNATAAA